MRMKRYLLLLPIFCLSCAAAKPAWVPDGGPSPPTSRDTLVGIGMAVLTRNREDDIKRADAAALSEIAKQIQVRMKEEMVIESEYSSTASHGSGRIEDRSAQRVTIMNRQYIDFTLEGARIKERFYDGKARCFYAMAVLNKPVTASRLLMESRELLRDSRRLEEEGLKMIGRGEIVPGIRKLMISADRYEAASEKTAVASILSSGPVDPIRMGSPSRRLLEITERVRLVPVEGDAQHARAGQPLPKPIVVRALYGKGTAIASLPIESSLPGSDGNEGPPVLSDEKGTARIKFSEMPATGKHLNEIWIAPDWNELIRSALNGIPPAWHDRFGSRGGIMTHFSLRTESTTTVDIVAPDWISLDNGGMVDGSVIVQPMADGMKAAGFLVKSIERQSRDLDIRGLISRYRKRSDLLIIVDGSLHLSSWRGGVPLYRARLTMTCYDYVRDEIIGSLAGQSIGGGPDKTRSSERAMAAAVQEHLPQFIQGIRDNLQ